MIPPGRRGGGRRGPPWGSPRYDRLPGTDEAEVAFVVTDAFQHRGLATLLLEVLAEAAWTRGIRTFVAETLVDNHDMLEVFSGSGFATTTRSMEDVVQVRFAITPNRAVPRGGCRTPWRVGGTVLTVAGPTGNWVHHREGHPERPARI